MPFEPEEEPELTIELTASGTLESPHPQEEEEETVTPRETVTAAPENPPTPIPTWKRMVRRNMAPDDPREGDSSPDEGGVTTAIVPVSRQA